MIFGFHMVSTFIVTYYHILSLLSIIFLKFAGGDDFATPPLFATIGVGVGFSAEGTECEKIKKIIF